MKQFNNMNYPMLQLKINELPFDIFPRHSNQPNYLLPELQRIKKDLNIIQQENYDKLTTFSKTRKSILRNYTPLQMKSSSQYFKVNKETEKKQKLKPTLTQYSFEYEKSLNRSFSTSSKTNNRVRTQPTRQKSIYICQSKVLDQFSIQSKDVQQKSKQNFDQLIRNAAFTECLPGHKISLLKKNLLS